MILASTDPIPHDAIAVRIGLKQELVRSIQLALINLDKSEPGRQVIAHSKKKLTGHLYEARVKFTVQYAIETWPSGETKAQQHGTVDPGEFDRMMGILSDRAKVRQHRAKLEALVAPAVGRSGAEIGSAAAMADEDLVNALAQYLDLEPLEKQALLELDSLRQRAEALVELLEMKLLIGRTPGLFNVAH